MRTAIILAALLLVPTASFSATIIVPDDKPTIQAAIDAAVDGDMVLVKPNTYVENIDFKGKAIAVRSDIDGNTLTYDISPETTIIDGSNPVDPNIGSVVYFKSGENASSVLEGFTLTKGTGTLYEDTPGQFIFCGGGIFCESPTPSLSTKPTITENIILSNKASTGGGIYCYKSNPKITNNTILKNTATIRGGGISCNESTPFIKYNTIEGNMFSGPGGGILCYKSDPVIANNYITGNKVLPASSGSYAGICCDGSSPLIADNFISGNTTGNVGFCGGVGCVNNSAPLITCNVISGNKGGIYGGGIVCGTSSPIINSNIIAGNKTTQIIFGGGGGIYCYDKSKPTITNNTIAANTSLFGGGGICTYSGASPFIFNSIFWENVAPLGKEIYIGTTTSPSTTPSSVVISYSDVQGGMTDVHIDQGSTLIWGAGMISADPLFLGPTNGDYHIPATSPCKDAGSNTASGIPYSDFEGDSRIANSTVDIGADEFYRHLYHTGNPTPGGTVELNFIDVPGTFPVGLWIAFNVLATPIPGAYGDWWLLPPMVGPFSLPAIPSSGVLILTGTLPTSPTTSYSLYFQAIMGTPLKLTNLCVMDVE